jgi:hypothetical protein
MSRFRVFSEVNHRFSKRQFRGQHVMILWIDCVSVLWTLELWESTSCDESALISKSFQICYRSHLNKATFFNILEFPASSHVFCAYRSLLPEEAWSYSPADGCL